jgi:hypothetical protein
MTTCSHDLRGSWLLLELSADVVHSHNASFTCMQNTIVTGSYRLPPDFK